MQRDRKLGRKLVILLTLVLPPLGVTNCLNAKPKILGQQGKFDFSAFNTNASGSFKVNFALVNTSNSTIYLQGNTNAKSTLIGTCNFAGTGCQCKFLDSAGATLATTSSAQISYDDAGNYYRCVYSGSSALTNVASVTLQSLDGNTSSGTIPVNTTSNLTLSQLLGAELDINRVRYVYRYQCQYNYLQKAGTTTQGFDCTNVATACEAGDTDASHNFCILKARWPFYLFTDTYSTNFSQKPSDKVYGSQAGLCSLQIKQFDCVGTAADPWGTPTLKFGLYDQLSGIWQTSVQLPAGPDQPAASYGFAAQANISGECPPGLIKQIFFTTTVTTTDIAPSHNFPSAQIATEVADPTATPSAFAVQQFGFPNGTCNGTACTLPLSFNSGFTHNSTYSSAGQTVFCVIPPTMLP